MGGRLILQGRLEEAIAACEKSVEMNPTLAESHYNLGIAWRRLGKIEPAMAGYRRAIRLRPEFADAHNNLGNALRSLGKLDEAVESLKLAVGLKSDFVEAHNNLGNALREQGNLDLAIACFRKAITLRPEANAIWSNLLYAMHFHRDYDAKRIYKEHRAWAGPLEASLAGEIREHSNDRSAGRRLKIGYVSADFRRHAAANFLLPLLRNHDAGNVEIFCYSGVPRGDAITAELKRMSPNWREAFALSDGELAERIRADGIDILVDLSVHMAGNRLPVFARRPAPVQITWLGYPSTTGLSTIDYRLSDGLLDPPGGEEFYSERTIRLPRSFWCYQPLARTPEVNGLPALENGLVTFGCLNNFAKVNAAVLQCWVECLRGAPNSRMLIHSLEGSHRQRVVETFERGGVSGERIEFVGRLEPAEYFRLYHRVDFCLDPFPYPGHTTLLDGLWMGVPAISMTGPTAVSRGGGAILTHLGLKDWIVGSSQEYVARAAEMCGDLAKLSNLRGNLRRKLQMSPLMDGRGFAGELEEVFRKVWRTWCG
jgi:predicted O-linked N-acetylglucosamine transferase (SPINDLY family)